MQRLVSVRGGAAIVSATLLAACGTDVVAADRDEDGLVDRDDVAGSELAAYWLGDSFDELALTHIRVDSDHVGFGYGSCDANRGWLSFDASGCPIPLDVQVWHACARNLSMYPEYIEPHEVTVRGVPSAEFNPQDGGGRLELYSGEVTIVIFALDPATATRAAEALVPANEQAHGHTDGDLPEPVPGAIEGTLPCPA